jgi:hypothetical protein
MLIAVTLIILALIGSRFLSSAPPVTAGGSPVPTVAPVYTLPVSTTGFITSDTSKARGIRNNNPFNIRISGSSWRGKREKALNTDGAFEQFDTMENGLRAGLKLLQNYYHKKGLKSVLDILNTFAPPTENHTNTYAAFVSKFTGFPLSTAIDLTKKENLVLLSAAILRYETGVTFSLEQINQAYAAI